MAVEGSVVTGRSPGDADHGGDGRVPEATPRAIEEVGAVGFRVEPVGLGTTAADSPVIGGSSAGAGGSGAVGDDPEPIGSLPRGKGAVVEGEETTEAPFVYREEDVLFRPAGDFIESLADHETRCRRALER
ncbi:hypothetical protein RHMOL_Rhmol05G0161500 [Rhododendron molle]|uniref:Uncharacterized protein n=1 Tax=Rhododendron molle TaxID=49168 RepID=A0ACC0NPY6_RHOML|nr:hypothetical protein RHMOL_Rhmol05G0161500 [Rhododendron molle]